jgi:hypothetical protein
MDRFEREFNEHLCKFLNDLYSFTKNSNVKKLIDIFDKIHTRKTANKIISTLGKYGDQIDNKDDTIFKNKLVILPGVDLSKLWPIMDKDQKNKIWLYLQFLCISANMMVQESESDNRNSSVMSDMSDVASQRSMSLQNNDLSSMPVSSNLSESPGLNQFNPYEGVGSDTGDFSTEDLFSGPDQLKGEESSGLPNLASMGGLGALKNMDISKFIDIKSLTTLIKENVNDKNIALAIGHLKEQIGEDIDEDKIKVIEQIFGTVGEELKGINTSGVIRISDIISPMENLVSRLGPMLKNNSIDLKYIWGIVNKVNSANGENADNKQFKLLSSFMSQQFAMMESTSGSADGTQPNDEVALNPEAYMSQCNDMLKDLGFGNLDLEKLNLSSLASNLTNVIGQNGGGLDMSNISSIVSSIGGCLGEDNMNQMESMITSMFGGMQPNQRLGTRQARPLNVQKIKQRQAKKK